MKNTDRPKFIRDPVHGDITILPSTVKFMDTPEIQRLREISQLGVVKWVFPGGCHTRFEHTLGVIHLANEIARNVFSATEYEDIKEVLSAAALFHDAGHAPFSHTLEEHKILTEAHELQSCRVAREVMKKVHGLSFTSEEVIKILKGRCGVLSEIISGTIDADRLDYLNRDALHTGVSYGIIDRRIIRAFVSKAGRLGIKRDKIIAETVLYSRYVMRAVVYDHKVARLLGGMLARAVKYALESRHLTRAALVKMEDPQLIYRLAEYEPHAKLIANIKYRRLPKLVGVATRAEVGEMMDTVVKNEWRTETEAELAQKLNISVDDLYLDVPKLEKYIIQESEMPVFEAEKNVGTLGQLSPLTKQINQQHQELWMLRFFAPKTTLEKAKTQFEKITGIKLVR